MSKQEAIKKTKEQNANKRKAGWARPLNSRKHHYFKEDETTSICGRWMLFSDNREPDTFESPDDCASCRQKLNKQKETK